MSAAPNCRYGNDSKQPFPWPMFLSVGSDFQQKGINGQLI